MTRRAVLVALLVAPWRAFAGSPEEAKRHEKPKPPPPPPPPNPGKPKKGDKSAPFDETEYRRRFRWPVR
jgi:hypothetical protein